MAEPADWSAFPEAETATDKWAGFPEAGPSRSARRRAARKAATSRDLSLDTITRPIDGDTLGTASGGALRLYGIDAPELNQLGWDRAGNPVQIGQQARGALSELVDGQQATPGLAVGQSYGRSVAPVSADGVDVGGVLARYGNALAAPDFMAADPQRRFEYLQAERLARQNGLGIHDTAFQPPAEYRKAALPEEQVVPQFWDTPTPFAGMRPDVAKEFARLLNDRSVPPDAVAAYARSNGGFGVDPAEVAKARKAAAKGNRPIGFDYKNLPPIMTDQGDGASGSLARGIGNGVLPNFLEETGAVVDALGGTSGRENVFNSDRRLADIYANNAAQNEAITRFDGFEHPWAQTVGEVAGGIVLPMGKVSSAAGLAKFGAAYGGLSGLGREGSIPERMISGVVGAGEGLAVTVLGGKALEAAAPYAKRLLGKKGEVAAEVGVDAAEEMADGSIPSPGTTPRIDPADAVPKSARPGDDNVLIPKDAEPAPSVSAPARQPDYLNMERPGRLDQPLTAAQLKAMSEGIDPADVLPIASNEVGSVEEAALRDAGRYAPASAPHEATALSRYSVRGRGGQDVRKVGPTDLIGWLRLRGGIQDQGGELSHMGIGNAARTGMEHVGQEARFGPLVADDGMTLDDAAHNAWEAGFFPELTERPDINTFLDALRGTQEGWRRVFHPDDFAELDRFNALRDERMALGREKSEAGQVWQDRSIPAEEPQPFPPPAAFEEWPAGGPDFAGNINLGKLETPQDIRRALTATESRVGFDAATRGRVTQAETEALAADLGMTPDKLLSRRKGQAFNAEEALAARQILAKSGNELVNMARKVQALDDPGDELLADFRRAWVRHASIQEQVAGMTAEAGRALQQFRQMADSRAVRGDVLAAVVRGGGGKVHLQDAAGLLLEAVETEPGKFNVLAEKALKPTWRNKLSELYINFLLSWPQTHAVNITSNTLTTLAQVPEHAAAALVGKARQMLPRANQDRIVASEVGQRIFGLIQGTGEGARMFAKAVKTGEPSDFISKVEGQEHKAIGGMLGTVVRVPTRLLTAEDEFFKGIARRMELNGLAARQAHRDGLKGEAAAKRIAELVTNPSDEMLRAAEHYGRYVTFQAKLGPAAQDISNFANRHMLAKVFLPFVRTPTNLLKFAVERSPAAPLLKEWRADFRAGGARRDLAIAKSLVGTGFGMAFYQAAVNGHVTGSAPTDPKKARLLYADGWKPYSVKVGDTYYSYRRLDPFSTTIGVAADLATLPEGMSRRQREDATTLLVASIMGNLANKTWLSGVSDVVGALHDPEQNADNMVQRLVGSLLVPNLVAGTARTLDPVQRETETTGDALRSRIPGLRDDLLPQRDIWGNPITNEGGIGPDFLTPVWTSRALKDSVNHELLQTDYAPGYPDKKVGGRELTPQEYDRYAERAGKASHAGLADLVGSPEWKALDPADKATAAKKVVDAARKAVRAELFGSDAKPADGSNADAWSAFPEAGVKADGHDWSAFPDAPQADVMGNLERAIPGVQFTSGFRTPEYQADMRKRGYKPAYNSAHLDGSGIDMLPPPGKSLGWLRSQVAKAQPNALLLVHDGHLHMSVPGWYGAPAIGNALAAGLRNPNSR